MPKHAHEFYETPPHYVTQLLQSVPIKGHIFEPCNGGGAISRYFTEREDCATWTNDIDPSRKATWHFDACDFQQNPSFAFNPSVFNWIITNPPFSLALPILQNALRWAPNVAFLLRVSFFEPTVQREGFLVAHPPNHIIYLPRTSFTGDGKSDSATCCWAMWQRDCTYQSIRVAPRFPKD